MPKNFSITILGSSSAVPTSERFPTSQLLTAYGRHYLLDCGEGTQIQLRKYKISFQRIDRIFISHLHADHFLGLPGLLATMDLLGRQKEIHIHANELIQVFMDGFIKSTYGGFSYPVVYHSIPHEPGGLIFENSHIAISSVPLKHAIPCYGFVVREKQKLPNIKKQMVELYKPTIQQIHEIKSGSDLVLDNGTIIKNEDLVTAAPPPRSYAFITDTLYTETILPFIRDVSLLYHEATFGEDMAARAKSTTHCTAKQAGTIALKGGVRKLMIGHYSVRYPDIEVLLKEARSVFENTICATEGLEIDI